MSYQPTEAQERILAVMNYFPETPKAIAGRTSSNISRQNASMQLRILADNGVIKQHSRGKFSLKPKTEATLKDFLDTDYAPPAPEPKKLERKQRDETSLETFAQAFPDHYRWLVTVSARGNSFAQSLMNQLHKGWSLTVKQMNAIEKYLYAR